MPGFQQNTGRKLVGGQPNQIGDQLRNSLKGGVPPQYHRAVVLNIIFDPQLLSQEDINQLKGIVSNPDYVDTMPPNTIIARLVSQGVDTAPKPCIVYPLYQSHIMFPIQAGEHVFVVFEDFQQLGTQLGRWLTRIHEDVAVEDVNFTHADRRFNPTNNPALERTSATADRSNGSSETPTPSFPNGGGTVDSRTLPMSGSNNPYDEIYNNTLASKLHAYEVVPRFTKRPQEFVLQGMSNSLIVLGQDRTGPALRVTGSDQKDQINYAGAVDIVVGRARYPLTTDDSTVPDTKSTSPFVVQNSRNNLEVDKVPRLRNNKTKNPKEGDPNYISDAARFFVCMNTKGDTNFGLLHKPGTDGQMEYADNTLRAKEDGHGDEPAAVSDRIGNSYCVAKADHIRIIARKASVPDGGTINGSILLLKEGTKDSDQGYIYINKEGMTQVEGKKIFLGKAITGAIGDQSHHEPYILWSKFQETVNSLHDEIELLKNQLSALVNALTQVAPTSLVSPGGGPDTAWTSLAPQLAPINPQLNQWTTKRDNTNQKVNDAKSTKIFGE